MYNKNPYSSIKDAKEQLQVIHGAKDFLRGSQEEEPHRYDHYQKQIDDLSRQENKINSWLGSKKRDYGRSNEESDLDKTMKYELEHFNDDLYERQKARGNNVPQGAGDDSDDDWKIPVYEDGNLLNPIKSGENEKSKDSLYPGFYSKSGLNTDSGGLYSPQNSEDGIGDLQVIDNEADPDRVDSKAAWQAIRDWVMGDEEGETNSGSFQTDPVSGKWFYVSRMGEKTPLSELGVDDATAIKALGIGSILGGTGNTGSQLRAATTDTTNASSSDCRTNGTTTALSGSIDSGNTELKAKSLVMRTADNSGGTGNTLNNSFGYNGGIERYSNTNSDSAQFADDPLSANAAYTEENKAKYNAIYEENLREIQALEAHKRQASLGTEGANILAPYIDMRLSVRYNQNRRIDEWRNAEKKAAEGSDSGESNRQSADTQQTTDGAGTGLGGQSGGGGGGRGGDTGSDLGVLSAKYESKGDPGIIGDNPGDPGGKSYGAYQLASKKGSVDEFLDWLNVNNSEYYQKLITAKQNDGDTFGGNFDKTWQQLAEADPSGFLNLQHSYIKYAYYDPIAKRLKDKYGFDINSKSKALKNVFWSTAVQHRYDAIDIFVTAGLSGSDEQIINGVYDERKLYLNGCSEDVKRSVTSRYESERKDALNMLKGQ